MGHILKNQNVEIQIDYPQENYDASRFDWTGKITSAKFKNIQLTTVEDLTSKDENQLGKGFYNEFGIDPAIGFDETEIGGWFHKIGLGLLKKEGAHYEFNKPYEINPAEFQISTDANRVLLHCISQLINGYSYELRKEIELLETGFTIKYYLNNTGEKTIQTDEYVHNFIAINNGKIGGNYILNFPFELKPQLFGETVNPELAAAMGEKKITFNRSPNKQFFLSNLSGGKSVQASWELLNLKAKIGIRESTNFQTPKINLWGWKHVISPELFFDINLAPCESTEWIRTYEFFEI